MEQRKDYSRIQVPFSGWKAVRMIGRGSFGEVFEIHRDFFGDTQKAAMKVISIPADQETIDYLYSSGFGEESIRKWCASRLDDIRREYSLMEKMKGNTNIVSCEDVAVVEKEDIGCDVYIRMELLTSLSRLLRTRMLEEEEIIKLGMDICRALELCESLNIIHRDIKPENIMISNFGDFKLGDFGIARTMEHTTNASIAGTERYMAPEVIRGEKYGRDVDTYSLGMVMYWLLNNRTMPFMTQGEIPTAAQVSEAQSRRLSGETVPAPERGSEDLKRIVMKACSFSRSSRYSSASEMLRDLEALVASGKGKKDPRTPETDPAIYDMTPEFTADDSTGTDDGTLSGEMIYGDEDRTVGLIPSVPAASDPQRTAKLGEINVSPDEAETEYLKKEDTYTAGGTDTGSGSRGNRVRGDRKKRLIPVIALAAVLVIAAAAVLFNGKDEPAAPVSVPAPAKGTLTYASVGGMENPVVKELAGRMGRELVITDTRDPGSALMDGEADILCGLDLEGKAQTENDIFRLSDPIYEYEGDYSGGLNLYIVTNRNDTALAEEIDRGLAEMKEDGTLGTLQRQAASYGDDLTEEIGAAPSVEFDQGGGEYVAGTMSNTYTVAFPSCSYDNPGFTFAGWLDGLRSAWDDYENNMEEYYYSTGGMYDSSAPSFLTEEEDEELSQERVHRLIAEWLVDRESFRTSEKLHDKVELDIQDKDFGVTTVVNKNSVPVDIVVVTQDNDDTVITREIMTAAVPPDGTGLLDFSRFRSSSVTYEYFVRESSLDPVEDSVDMEIRENGDEEKTAVITNTGDSEISQLSLAYMIYGDDNITVRGTGIIEDSLNLQPGESIEAELIDSRYASPEDIRLFIGDCNDLNFFSSAVVIDK